MKTENLKCNRCGHILEVDEVLDYDDNTEGITTYLKCPYCGVELECTEPAEDDKMNFAFYRDGEPIDGRYNDIDIMNGHCTNCGHEVSMSGNFMLSDYDEEITSDDDDKMNFVLNECPYCGMHEVRWDTSENDKKEYEYWAEDNWLHEHMNGYDLEYLLHVWEEENGVSDEELSEMLKTFKWLKL